MEYTVVMGVAYIYKNNIGTMFYKKGGNVTG